MTGLATQTFIEAYREFRAPTTFLSQFFSVTGKSFVDSEEVEWDVRREGRRIASVTNPGAYDLVSETSFTNKKVAPPLVLPATQLTTAMFSGKRGFGENPYAPANPGAQASAYLLSQIRDLEASIRESIEMQAAQIFQTGQLSLPNSLNGVGFALDYKPKATHFPVAANAWGGAGATVLADLEALCEVVKSDGNHMPTQAIMGTAAYRAFINDANVRDKFETRRIDQGTISPMVRYPDGGIYRGYVEVGSYRLDVWTYDGKFVAPTGGAKQDFLTPSKVIVRSPTADADMQLLFGRIDNLARMLGVKPNISLPNFPSEIASVSDGIRLFTNVWMEASGESAIFTIGSRPLCVPKAIDTFGCLSTGAA